MNRIRSRWQLNVAAVDSRYSRPRCSDPLRDLSALARSWPVPSVRYHRCDWSKNVQHTFPIQRGSFTLVCSKSSSFFPMQIGDLTPSNNVFLAPMAGVTELPLRELAVELGVGMAVGEMQTADLRLADSRKTQQRQRQHQRTPSPQPHQQP